MTELKTDARLPKTAVRASMGGLNVISLFNGMNTGRQALENQGFKVNKYYSSEIKPYAIELTQHHFPDTIQVGDVTKWREWDIDWTSIDLILSGSPCQDLSGMGKNKPGIYGLKSSLFFVFIDILNHIKSKNKKVIFFQENVASADIKDIGIMSRELGLYPIKLNSSLVTAQLRPRYYWTNIRTRQTMFDTIVDIPAPKDKGIILKDILTSGYSDRNKSLCLMQGYYSKAPKKEYEKLLKRYNMGMLPIVFEKEYEARLYNKIEMCRLQGFPDNYCDTISVNKAASLLGDGWTLPIVEHIFSFMHIA